MVDVVLNRSRHVMQFLSWYCANTVRNLSSVISKIYDVLKRISEYFEYFESFQLNIQLEKGCGLFLYSKVSYKQPPLSADYITSQKHLLI